MTVRGDCCGSSILVISYHELCKNVARVVQRQLLVSAGVINELVSTTSSSFPKL